MKSDDVIATAALPDFDRMAADFDLFLPLIQPVGLAVLEHLPKLPEGANVLDVACGTGEPGLTLARLSQRWQPSIALPMIAVLWGAVFWAMKAVAA